MVLPFANTGSCLEAKARYGPFSTARERDGLRRACGDRGARRADRPFGGEDYVNFASNDYLALRFHPALIKRARSVGGR